MKVDCKVKGEFQFAIHRNGRDVPVFEKPSKNMILDYFLNAVNTGQALATANYGDTGINIGRRTRVGTGTTPVSPSDTGLVNEVLVSGAGTVVSATKVYNEATNTITGRRVIRSEYAPATQSYNLSEVAVYTSENAAISPTTPIVSRALIQDNQGNPTTITLSVGDILVVFYTFEAVEPAIIEQIINLKGQGIAWRSIRQSALIAGQYPWSNSVVYNLRMLNVSIPVYATTTPLAIGTVGAFINSLPPGTIQINWFDLDSAIPSITPKNPDTSGIRNRQRINLNFLNQPIHAIFQPQEGSWRHHFDPPFSKTDQETIEVETFVKVSRA